MTWLLYDALRLLGIGFGWSMFVAIAFGGSPRRRRRW